MPLVLQPTFNETTREQYEAFLDEVRARRLTAALEYAQGQQLQLDRESDLAQKRLAQQYDMLGRELQRMEALDEKIQERMVKIAELSQSIDFIDEMKAKGVMGEADDDV